MTARAANTEVVLRWGSLADLPELLAHHAPAARYAVVSDSNVAPVHGQPVVERLAAAGQHADLFTIRAGEPHKTTAAWATLVEALAAEGLGRDGCVVAVGGGVTGDLAGFAAATYARGVAVVQVPTSLLAMVDASLGGKTGVDLAAGKNLVGAFHPPRLVLIDPQLLGTLPPDAMADGLAEAVKHGAIADTAYLDWIEANAEAVLAHDPAALHRLVTDSVRIKGGVVERDPEEAGERAVLNFGHTIGHAIEAATDYSVGHGSAVSLGMVAEAAIGEAVGVTEAGTGRRIQRALRACGLPIDHRPLPEPKTLLQAARTDKKNRGGAVRYVLLARLGVTVKSPDGGWAHPVPDDRVEEVLNGLRRVPGLAPHV
jgi:3-dehydroquinate synthase